MQTYDALAIRYNGISILENMHAAESFQMLLENPSCNWLSGLSKVFPNAPVSKMLRRNFPNSTILLRS